MCNSIYDKNKELLIASNMDKAITDGFYHVEDTKDGYHTFRYNNNGKKIYINSKYNVKNEVDMLLSNIDFSKDSLFVVYGIGMGYHIKELIKRSSSKSKIFVIEPSLEILNTYLRNENLLDIAKSKVSLFYGDDQNIIAKMNPDIFSFSILPLSINYIPVIMLSYQAIYGEWIEKINKRIIDLFKHAMFNVGNDVEDTIIGLQNNFNNIKELIQSPSIEILKDKYTDMPAIIVSAGPSLDKNIEELKNVKGKALILAVDAVISTLTKHDIIPDAIFSIERGIKTYEAFYKNNVVDDDIVFIGPPVVTKEILDKLEQNKKLLCLKQDEKINEWINDDILCENRLLKMGTSCAHIALAYAKYVNANPIVFIGQDLAFTKEGVTHSEFVEIKEKVGNSNDIYYVKGIDGDMLPTNYAFRNFLIFLETAIAQDNSGRLYIDATEGGAFKHGTQIMKLKEVISSYCTRPVPGLNSLIPDDNKLDITKYNKAIEELKVLIRKFTNMKIDCKKHLAECIKLENNLISSKATLKEAFRTLRKNDVIEQTIYKEDVVRTFLQSNLFLSILRETSLGNNETYEIAVEKTKIQKELMNSLIISCDAILRSINDIIDQMTNIN